MAVASLGKTVVYKPSATDQKVKQIGGKVDTSSSHAGIITRVESGTTVSVMVFLDNGNTVYVQNVKNDDGMTAGHSWAYPV